MGANALLAGEYAYRSTCRHRKRESGTARKRDVASFVMGDVMGDVVAFVA